MTEKELRASIQRLHQTNPQIRMDVHLQKPKLTLKDQPATIVGVYPHIFLIEEDSAGYIRRHTLQYTDLLIGLIVIRELTTEP